MWDPIPEPNESVQWSGACQNGVAQGRGVAQWFKDGKFESRTEGEWRDGKRNGHGVYTSANGDRYEGQWRDGQPIKGFSTGSKHETEIPLQKEAGTLVVPVRINDALTLNFIVDSGAADVSIPADVVMTLIRLGTIKNSDFLGEQTYRLADGSTFPSDTFRIRLLKVGDREIENVTGSIASVAGGLLLGQSFLSRFKSWSIDNNRQMLLLD
jgi:predicted aspartyl protease